MFGLKAYLRQSAAIIRAPSITLNATVGAAPPPPPPEGVSASLTVSINEGPAPMAVCVSVDSVTGFATDNIRDLYIEMDFGERYPLTALDDPLVHPDARFLRGKTAGFYRGSVAGHAYRGTDTNPATSAPVFELGVTDTITRDIEVFITDGLTSLTVTKAIDPNLEVTLYNPFAYYTDTNKSIYQTDAPEINRGVVIYSKTGDFSEAPFPSGNGVVHIHVPTGEYNGSEYIVNQNIGARLVMFEAGETFTFTNTTPLNDAKYNGYLFPDWNQTFTTWTHSRSSAAAELKMRNWWTTETSSMFRMKVSIKNTNNANLGSGMRLHNLKINCGDYDPAGDNVWWKTLNYTGKTGTFATGEEVSDGLGNRVIVIDDTGTSLLAKPFVVSFQAETPVFANGALLTGPNGTAEFVAAGSDQRPLPPILSQAFSQTLGDTAGANRNCFLDLHVNGANNAFESPGTNVVFSNVVIKDCWNYGISNNGNAGRLHLVGTVIGQSVALTGGVAPLAPFPTAVDDFRNDWNTTAKGQPTNPIENNVRHSAVRVSNVVNTSVHYCYIQWSGGHGAAHQPTWRTTATDGPSWTGVWKSGEVEDDEYKVGQVYTPPAPYTGLYMVIVQHPTTVFADDLAAGYWEVFDPTGVGGNANCNVRGSCFFTAQSGLTFQRTGENGTPWTPNSVVVEGNHFRAQSITDNQHFGTAQTNWLFENNIVEWPTGLTIIPTNGDYSFISFDTTQSYTVDGDSDPLHPPIIPVVRYNTFVFNSLSTVSDLDLPTPLQAIRTTPITYANNVYLINKNEVRTVPAEIESIDRAFNEFDALWRPLTPIAATGDAPSIDAEGTARPAVASIGALEPSA